MNVVFVGTAKGVSSARKGFYYAGPGNKFYSVLYNTGLTSRKINPEECYELASYKIGLTDLVPNKAGNDTELEEEDFDIESFHLKILKFKPKIVAFNGKLAASYFFGLRGKTKDINFGLQNIKVLDTLFFVLPSTSGSGARYWNEKWWKDLNNLINHCEI